jgi:hypothetical protein
MCIYNYLHSHVLRCQLNLYPNLPQYMRIEVNNRVSKQSLKGMNGSARLLNFEESMHVAFCKRHIEQVPSFAIKYC